MADYPTASRKYDPATGSIAIRTRFPEVGDHANHAWLMASTSAVFAKTTADVDSWEPLYTQAELDDAVAQALSGQKIESGSR